MQTFALASLTVVFAAAVPVFGQTTTAPRRDSSPSTQGEKKARRSAKAPASSNVRLLTALSQPELLLAMNFMSASLGVGCDFCHVRRDEHLDFANDAKEEKGTAREMIELVFATNNTSFSGQTVVSCYTCHRGSVRPINMVSLPLPPRAPATADSAVRPPQLEVPEPEAIFSKYVAAIGGPAAAATLRNAHSYSMAGTRTGSDGKPLSIRIDRALPSLMSISSDRPDGTRVSEVLTKNDGWMRDARETRHLRPMERQRMRDAMRALDQIVLPTTDAAGFRVRRKDKIDDYEVWILDRNLSASKRQLLYFDEQSGLLIREVIVTDDKIGRLPEQTDFSDYRDVNGVTLPFTTKTSSVDSRSDGTRIATEILLDPSIEAERFTAPPKPDH